MSKAGHGFFERRKQKCMSALIAGTKILDIGYAQSPNVYLTGDVHGMDIQEAPKPSNYADVSVVNLNYCDFPYASSSFDTVIMGDVIEHLENPSRVLRETNRVLRNGGKLIVSTPHANHWETTIRNWFLSWLPDPDPGEHINNWTRMDFMRLLRINGFDVIHQWGTFLSKSLPVYVPVTRLPVLGWIIIYETVKRRDPSKQIVTNTASGERVYIRNSRSEDGERVGNAFQ